MLTPTPTPARDDFLELLTAPIAAGRGCGLLRPAGGRRGDTVSSSGRGGSSAIRRPATSAASPIGRGTAATPASAPTPAPPGRAPHSTASAASRRPWSPRRQSRSPSCLARGERSPTSPRPRSACPPAGSRWAPSGVSSTSAIRDGCMPPAARRRGRSRPWPALCRRPPSAGRCAKRRASCRGPWRSSPRAGSAIAPASPASPLPPSLARRLSSQDYYWSSEVTAPAGWRLGAGLNRRCGSHSSPTTAFRPAKAWAATFSSSRCRLRERGHEVTILARGEAFARLARIRRRWPARSPLSALSAAAVPSGVGRRAELAGWLGSGADGAEVLHVHLPLLPPLHTRLPIVATVHSPMLADTAAIGERGPRPTLIRANARLFSRRYEQWYLDHAAQVVVVSDAVRAELEAALPPAPIGPPVVPNGVDAAFFGFVSLRQRRGAVLYVGRLGYRKGLFRLLEAFARLPPGLATELVLVGEGPLEGRCARAPRNSGSPAAFDSPGFLDRIGVRAELQRRRLLREPRRLRDRAAHPARGDGERHARREHGDGSRRRDGCASAARGCRPPIRRRWPSRDRFHSCATRRPPRLRARAARALVATRFDWEHVVDRLEWLYGVRREQRRVIGARRRLAPRGASPSSCPGFAADRVRRQPWHVADGLARGLLALGHEVIAVHRRGRSALLRPLPWCRCSSPDQRAAAPAELCRLPRRKRRVDRVFLVTGAAQLARLRALDLGAPVSLVMASPRLRLSELLRLGPGPFWRERSLLALPLLNAALPGPLLRARHAPHHSRRDHLPQCRGTAALRARCGLPAGRLLRPQVDAGALLPPARGRPFTIGYFGPPLAARGADLALERLRSGCSSGPGRPPAAAAAPRQ